MQYLISVLELEGQRPDDTSGSATAEEAAAIEEFNDGLQSRGQWVFAGGLAGPGTATVIDNRSGSPVLTDGPYLESKEYVGGFWIVEAPDLDAALKLATAGSQACNRRVEVRPFL